VSIILPGQTLSGTTGKNLKIEIDKKKVNFLPKCHDIAESDQSWTIEPDLPLGVEIDTSSGEIIGSSEQKLNKRYTITVSGEGKKFSEEIRISILKPLPSNIVSLIKGQSSDGTSIGHGICEFIDNSIDADATKIDIMINHEVFSNDPNKIQRPWVIVADNGKGILKDQEVTSEALQDALGFASSPDLEYDQSRLGAYGVGLPAAALTTAIFCTIFTKRNGKTAVGHMSYEDIEESNELRFFDEEDIPDHLKQAQSFSFAKDKLKEMETGTMVLLQDHWQLKSKIVDQGTEVSYTKFKQGLDIIKNRLKDYFGLVYHKFMETGGVDLRRTDGSIVNRRISISLGGPIRPIDPLMEHADSQKIGKLGTHIKEFDKLVCTINEKEMYYSMKMAVLPGQETEGGHGRLNKDGSSFDSAIGNALLVFNSIEGSDKIPQPREAQGLYLYRNSRLIEFATWKGMYSHAPQAQVARVSVSTPIGLPLHDPKLDVQNDFSVDNRKRLLRTTAKIQDEMKAVIQKQRLWHVDDTKKHPFVTRATKRAAYDNIGKTKKKKSTIKIRKAVFSPPKIESFFSPSTFEFQDLTPGTGSSPTRSWKLNGEQIGTGKKCVIKIEEPGQHKILLSITSGKKKWQNSIKFTALEHKTTKKKKTKENLKNEWNVIIHKQGPLDPPIVFNEEKQTYEINPNNPSYRDVIRMMEMLGNG